MPKPLLPKVRCSHILLSHEDAIESTHSKQLYFAVHDAKMIIGELLRGGITWGTAVKEHSACPHSWYRDGDLGWFDITDGVGHCTDSMYYTISYVI